MTQSLSFSSWGKGELSPINRGHIDLEQYYASAESLDNMVIRPYAVPVRRAGTKYAGEVKDFTKDTRLIEFVFNINKSYIIEMGDEYFRFWDSDGVPITFDLSTVVAWADAFDYVAGDVVSSTSSDAWVSGVYAVGDYVTNGGDLYVCIKITATLPLVEEPGVGSDWETYWTLIGDEDRFFLCLQDHLSVTADNKPRFGTDWEDYWYDMSAAAGLTDSDWIVEVDTPYSEAQIWDVDYAQKDDTLKLTHQSHDIAELRRYADNKWAFIQGVIEGPPWEDLNEDPSITINAASAAVADPLDSASILYRSTHDIFSEDDVGRYFRHGVFNGAGEQGYFKVVTFDNTKDVHGYNVVALAGAVKTTKWARNAFIEDNYPAHVTYYEDRLVLANTPKEPQKIWLSKSNIYNDFNVTDADNGGFDMVLNTEQANDIKWLSAGESLASGTFGAEFTSRSPSDGSLNNTNKNARRQSGWGSDFIRPKKIGNRVYFVQRTGRKLREYLYIDAYDNYAAEDMTKYSDHITLSGIVDMDYQRNQDSLLWCVLANGTMAILSRHPDEEVQAWTPWHTSNGVWEGPGPGSIPAEVKSIRFIPSPDGSSDRGFIIVKRTDEDANTVKYIEYFDNHVVEDDTRQDALYYVDSGTVYDNYAKTVGVDASASVTIDWTITSSVPFFTAEDNGHFYRTIDSEGNTLTQSSAITVVDSTHITFPDSSTSSGRGAIGGLWAISRDEFTGLGYIEGQGVHVFADGQFIKETSVQAGTVLTSLEHYVTAIGISITSTIQTNPLNAQTPTGMAKGHIRGINGLSIEVYRSLGIEYSSVGGTDDADWFPVGVPEGTDTTTLYTGTIANLTFDGGKNYEGYIYLRQTKPYSMNLLGIYPELKFSY